jgi:hypothetical protein
MIEDVSKESMVICAIRYTIGRSSYIVSEGQQWAIEWGEKSERVRNVIIRDLKEEIDRCDRGFNSLGDKFDEDGWRGVFKKLENMNTNKITEEELRQMMRGPRDWRSRT